MRVIKNNDNNTNDDNDENDDADHAVDNDDVDDGGEGPMVVMVVAMRMVKKVVVKMNMIMMIATERNHPNDEHEAMNERSRFELGYYIYT